MGKRRATTETDSRVTERSEGQKERRQLVRQRYYEKHGDKIREKQRILMAERRAAVKAKRRKPDKASRRRKSQESVAAAEASKQAQVMEKAAQKAQDVHSELRELLAARHARLGWSLPPSSDEGSESEDCSEGVEGAVVRTSAGSEFLGHRYEDRPRKFRLSTPTFSSPPPDELQEKMPSFYEKLWAAVETSTLPF
ncbi:hypothetical protein B0H15DRAFT_806473 [Mycena belliarum]|uniref:Uncharacterized protein n=1 Tax=Mycena belliarum TaxID=1033014 RepID=A0AAD6TS07_9AGAR|nr:hypothetical protein B0H15DRAFT_806473 [Mycena belliae]